LSVWGESMEPEITQLAATASTTLVALLATDAWQGARDGLVALWRRARPDRTEAIAGELDDAREDLLTAQAGGDRQTADEIGAEWQGRIRRLLGAHPELLPELSALLTELTPEAASAATASYAVDLRATASGEARVYQAGRDMHLGER
jgi:hypothetical protein